MRLPRTPIPPPLGALLVAVATVGVAWALFTPPFHVPDEDAHLAYVQSLAEDGRRPATGERYSPEQRHAENFAGGRWIVNRPEFRPAWSEHAERHFAAARAAAPPRTETLASTQAADPPLYFAYEAVPHAAVGGDLFDRLFAMRLWSALLLLVTTTAAWLLAGELFARDRLLQLVTAGCVGLQPMVTYMSGAVNPDAAAFATGGLVLWLAVRTLRRGPTRGNVAGLVATVLAAALSKTVLLTLAPVAIAAIVAGRARTTGRLPVRAMAAAAILFTLLAAATLALSGTVREKLTGPGDPLGFLSYLWQYYLPRLPFQDPVEGLGTFKAWIWVTGSWGRFGWLEVRFPYPVYAVLVLLALAAFAAAAVAIRRRRVAVERGAVALLGAAAACLVLGLHVGDYSELAREGKALNQGRYILPLLPIGGAAVAAALTNLAPVRRRAQGAAVVLGGMVGLQLLSFAVVAGRFYV
jgi:hypothetical protein